MTSPPRRAAAPAVARQAGFRSRPVEPVAYSGLLGANGGDLAPGASEGLPDVNFVPSVLLFRPFSRKRIDAALPRRGWWLFCDLVVRGRSGSTEVGKPELRARVPGCSKKMPRLRNLDADENYALAA